MTRWWLACLLTAACVAKSAPIVTAGPSLTAETWSETVDVASSSWLVEHYSPYCPHCRNFAPTWKSLVDSLEADADRHDFHFAQVDCAANGDLCAAHDVKYYPSLFLYKGGKFVEEFDGQRTVEALESWIKERWISESSRVTPVAAATSSEVEDASEQAEAHLNSERSTGTVEPLSKAGLARIKSGEGRPSFVKFFAPWCSHCKAMAPAWKELAAELQGVDVFEIDCEGPGNKATCREEGVKGFPTLYFYNGAVRAEYAGRRTVTAMKAWVEKVLASSNIKTLTTEQEVQDAMDKDEVALFYLSDSASGNHLDKTLLDNALKAVVGSAPMYITTRFVDQERGTFVASRAGQLSFFKPPTSASFRDRSRAVLDWIRHAKLPSLTEITAGTYKAVFPESFVARPPLVMLALLDPDDERSKDALRSMSTSKWGHRDDVLWTWVDRKRWSKWTTSMFGSKTVQESEILVMDPASQKFWAKAEDGRPFGLDPSRLDAALDSIRQGALHGQSYQTLFNHLTQWLGRAASAVFHSSLTLVFVLFAVAGVAIACSKGRRAPAQHPMTMPRSNSGYASLAKRE